MSLKPPGIFTKNTQNNKAGYKDRNHFHNRLLRTGPQGSLRELRGQLGLRLRSPQPEARPLETVPFRDNNQIKYLFSLLLRRTTKITQKQLDSVAIVRFVFSFDGAAGGSPDHRLLGHGVLRCHDDAGHSRKGPTDRGLAGNTICGYSCGSQCPQVSAEGTVGALPHSSPWSWAALTRPPACRL